jgi:protein-L-isoaspartate O-methyltransferase
MKIHYASQFDSDRIKIVLDNSALDWHIDAGSGYRASQMAALLSRVCSMGYETLPADECEDEILPNGDIRIYLVPVSA